ncbi:hypothetical protein [Sporolactobacillus vineae]|uniref:hypothetical protein n=1 Tax=Sporolactobacillus vineae TaxID=444463 RepID=UPI000307AD0D|nr:hypothetical protein [Sporolactobacillus vineae]
MNEEPLNRIEKKLDALDQRLEKLESADHDHRSLFGPNVWVLVPVVAIIMWGLKGILS